MQSMHQMQPTHNEPTSQHQTQLTGNNQMQIQQQVKQEQDHQHHQQLLRLQEDQSSANMTILEPVQQQSQSQPILSVLNPVQQQQQVVAHLGQQQPHLHQLQTPSQTGDLLQIGAEEQHHEPSIESPHLDQKSQQSGSNAGSHSSSNRHNRQQLEGIVADGGGPIVQWLLDNYEIADGESLPRSTVYNHYLAHCRQLQMSSVNAASFGKLIRSVFVGLKTRRLGTRGHSKYHYFGVRAKQHVRLDWIQREMETNEHDQRHHLHETGSNGQPDARMTDNGSESDSMECGAGSGPAQLSTSSGGAKRFKRHGVFGGACDGGAEQGAQRVAAIGCNQMMRQHYDSDGQQAACLQACSEMNCHHSSATRPTTVDDTHSMYTNGYGSYYSGANGAYGEQQLHEAAHKDNMHGEHEGHMIAAGNWSAAVSGCDEAVSSLACDLENFRNYLGQNNSSLVDEAWPKKPDKNTTGDDKDGDTAQREQFEQFERCYKDHYRRLVGHIGGLDFVAVDHCLRGFWLRENKSHWAQQANGAPELQPNQVQNGGQHYDPQLTETLEQLKLLTCVHENIERIVQIDRQMYSAIESLLMPNLFSPIPRPLTQMLRAFARNFPNRLELFVKDYPNQFQIQVTRAAREFGHTMRRYISINHLASSSRAVWTRRSALAQMIADLSRIDLRDIEHQVSLMIRQQQQQQQHQQPGTLLHSPSANQSSLEQDNQHSHTRSNHQAEFHQTTTTHTDPNNENYVYQLQQPHPDQNEATRDPPRMSATNRIGDSASHDLAFRPAQLVQSFLNLLNDPDPANAWPSWCRRLVEARVESQSFDEARNFVLRWNYYISLIMKELTLKSAPSLGSFQLIRLLFDEYIYYLAVSKFSQDQDNNLTGQLLRPSSRFVENV